MYDMGQCSGFRAQISPCASRQSCVLVCAMFTAHLHVNSPFAHFTIRVQTHTFILINIWSHDLV